jgi:hypothetical protein
MSEHFALGRDPSVLGEPTPILRTPAPLPHLHDMKGRESSKDHFVPFLDCDAALR